MMEVFETGIKFLLVATPLCFLVLFCLSRSWAAPMHSEHCNRVGVLVGILYSFLFFLGGFIIVSLFSLAYENLVSLIKLISF